MAWKFANSVVLAVATEYPEHPWQPWHFARTSNGWAEALYRGLANSDIVATTTVQLFVEDVAQQLGVSQLEDWYRYSLNQLDPKIRHITATLGGLPHLLAIAYPHHTWDFALLNSRTNATQRRLYLDAKAAFPGEGT